MIKRSRVSFRCGWMILIALTLLVALNARNEQIAWAAGSTITVTTLGDTTTAGDGNCSLREAILNGNANGDTTTGDCTAGSAADTIIFSATGTITLASSLPDITDDLTISGQSVSQMTIDANLKGRALSVPNAAVRLFVDHLVIKNGVINSRTVLVRAVPRSGMQAKSTTRCGLSMT